MGKDVPSRASEFSHPDIVIGLTIAAYRYEGLRFKDFHAILSALRQRMLTESGPYPKRATTKLYNEWVFMGNGRVRGTNTSAAHPSEVDTHEERERSLARVVVRWRGRGRGRGGTMLTRPLVSLGFLGFSS